MNPIRRVEIGCGVALSVAAVAVLLHAAPGTRSADNDGDGAQARMPVVVITGKRMTAPEKRQAAEAEAAARDSGSGA